MVRVCTNLLFLFAPATLSSCAVDSGEGRVQSDHLYVEECADGPFDLVPTSFTANPDGDKQTIRVQRGDRMQDLSDGMALTLFDVPEIVARIGEPIPVSLPPGTNPVGHAVRVVDEPTLVAITLYLNDSCHEQDVSLQAISGTITFSEVWEGDTTAKKKDRLIEARFSVDMADPRDLPPDGSAPPADVTSAVDGDFSFYFRRGQPGQPFPGIE
jgi:hypothetical protein